MLGVRRRGFSSTATPSVAQLAVSNSLPLIISEQESDDLLIANPVASGTPTIQWIYPLADADSSSIDRHRMVPSADTWEEFIEVIGGTPPYNYDIIEAPSGFEIGHIGRSTLATRQATYFRWTNPQVGSHTISVRVRDQVGGTPAVLTYTAVVYANTDTTKFMYIDSAAGSNSNAGTKSAPKQTLAACWGPSEEDSAHANKQIFFNGGTYVISTTSGLEFSGSSIGINDVKPKTLVGVYGTRPRVNNGTSASDGVRMNFGITARLRISNMDFGAPSYAGASLGRRHMQTASAFVFGGLGNVKFIGTGSTGTANVQSNNSCCFLLDESTAHEHMAFTYLEFDGCEFQSGIQNYNVSRIGASGWRAHDATGCTVMHDKGNTITDVQMLCCDVWENLGAVTVFRRSEWINSPTTRERLSSLYCNTKTALGWVFAGSSGDNYNGCVSGRCTYNTVYNEAGHFGGTVTSNRDFVQHTDAATNGWRDTQTGTLVKTNIQSDNTVAALDSSNLLQGSFLSLKGTNGAEMTVA
jgi:hypothetical protein